VSVTLADANPFLSARTSPDGVARSESGEDPLARLAQEAGRGDRQAMGKLLHALAPGMLRLIGVVMGAGRADVDDVAQEALLSLARSLPRFRGDCRIEWYAQLLAVRHAIAARKRRQLDDVRFEDDVGGAEQHGPSPSEEASSRQRRELLQGLLDEIPEPQAEVLVLRVVLGHSLEETARLVNAPVNTVRSRLRLAREALRDKILHNRRLAAALEVGP